MSDLEAFASLVHAELTDPKAHAAMHAEVAVGDLSEQAARDALRLGIESVAAKIPPVGS